MAEVLLRRIGAAINQSNIKCLIITNNTNWIVPKSKDQKFHVRIFGSGGGGGDGGGGGGWMNNAILTLPKGSIINIIIGNNTKVNTVGGTTSFGAYLSANGGKPPSAGIGGEGGSGGGGYHGGNGGRGHQFGGGGGGGGVAHIGRVQSNITITNGGNGGAGGIWGGGGGGGGRAIVNTSIAYGGAGGTKGTYGGAGGNGQTQSSGANGTNTIYSGEEFRGFGLGGVYSPKSSVSGICSSYSGGHGGGGYGGNGGCSTSGGSAEPGPYNGSYADSGGGGGGYGADGADSGGYADHRCGGGGGGYGDHPTGSGGGGYGPGGYGRGGGDKRTENTYGNPGICIIQYYI